MRLSPNRAILALLLCVWMVVPFVNSHAEDAATPASGGDAILSPTDLQHAERCPICKDFAYKHHNPLFPSFQCLPQPMRQRGLAEKRRMVCPVCNTVHDVEFVRELDPKGGIDTDFCYHPLKDADYTTNIYTCTNCGYTAYAGGFYEMPMGRKAVDADLESAIDRHFMLESSFKSWVRSNLARPLHDKLTELAKQIHPDQDWTAIKSQASIPLDMKLDYLHRCYSRLGVSYEFLAGMYMRFTYIYRNQFCEAKVTSELKRGYILTLPLLFESESFENETEILEDLGSLKHGELAYTLGIKWGEYSVRELIDRYIEVIRMINGIMDGTAKQEDINRAKVWGLTEPDLLQAKFVLFLELSSAYLRLGDLTLSQKSLEKAEALNEGDKLFANFPEKATKEQLTSREQAKIRTRLVIQEKMRDFVNHLKYLYQSITYLKESIRHKGLRAIYYPTQTYLVGNLYYRVELYDVAKLWFKMAKRSSVIYDFLNLPPKTRSGFNELLNSMLEDR
ncbi:MAG: DUF2225 domain-containing protein [Planctomycetota bacterium]|nr:DUF2225 domain-containing protein [Planctomycetota bacterium]